MITKLLQYAVRLIGRLRPHASLLLSVAALALSLTPCSAAAAPQPAPDAWLTNTCQYPQDFDTNQVHSGGFASLRAEIIVGRLKILWSPEHLAGESGVTACVSFEAPGHWPARDWRTFAMVQRGQTWETAVPVTDVDLPLVYFVCARDQGATNVSPMRVCHPRAAGLAEPTRVFWPFLEGFEEGLQSWRLLTPSMPPLTMDSDAFSGKSALLVSLPAGKRSVTVATTRLRGWHARQHHATGVRCRLRMRAGEGQVRFTLLAHAFTTNQVVGLLPNSTKLTAQWQEVSLPFSLFPRLPLFSIDLLVLEFVGEGPREFLVDDLELLGLWPPTTSRTPSEE